MSENVADAAGIESQEAAVEATEATPPTDELATLKKRLAGKDQAYTKLKSESDTAKAELDALRAWKAEKEYADLTEVEKLQKRLAEFEERATAAEQRAERIRLEKSYPHAVDLFGDDPLPSEERLAALEARLAPSEASGDDEAPIHVDPNRPKRPVGGAPKSLDAMDGDELAKQLAALGNPFLG